jgi:hypothetical protein
MASTWQEVAGQIIDYAPAAGAALGSLVPGVGTVAGGAVGAAIKAVAAMFGVKSADPTPDEIQAAIKADPEAALKLKKLDYDFAIEMRQADKEEHIAEINALKEDLASARDRQIQHEKVTGKSDINLYVIAWLYIAGFFGFNISMLLLIFYGHFTTISPSATLLLGQISGAISAGCGMVLQYFFGTSKRNEATDRAMLNSVTTDTLAKMFPTNGNGGK